MRCNVLQCVAVCCSVLQCAVYCSVLQCVVVYCSVLQCVAVPQTRQVEILKSQLVVLQ